MVTEIGIGFQEPVVIAQAGIPGGIQIVVQIVQFHNIPSVGAAASDAGNQTSVNAKLQRQPVKQQCITLADCRFIHHGRIGGEFTGIVFIIQIGIVISNIGADVVIDRPDLFIIRFTGQP